MGFFCSGWIPLLHRLHLPGSGLGPTPLRLETCSGLDFTQSGPTFEVEPDFLSVEPHRREQSVGKIGIFVAVTEPKRAKKMDISKINKVEIRNLQRQDYDQLASSFTRVYADGSDVF